jgi:hypothetical protein
MWRFARRRTRQRDSTPRCFLHVPKSAGSSVHAALEAALPPGSLAPHHFDPSVFTNFEDFDLLRREARAQIVVTPAEVRSLGRYQAVSGHFSLPTLLQVAAASSISTVLREPRARLLSLYAYWRTSDLGDFWEPYQAVQAAQRPLAEFLSTPQLAPATDNQVCRMLLYGDPRLPASRFASPRDIDGIAADAISLLDSLGFVGILELKQCVWRGLSRFFSVELKPQWTNATRGISGPDSDLDWRLAPEDPNSQTASATILPLIENRTAADALVYNRVLAQAGIDGEDRERLRRDTFMSQLTRASRLTGSV